MNPAERELNARRRFHNLYADHDTDGEGADRCGGCPTRTALAHERDLVRRLIRDLATARGVDPRVIALGHGIEW